VPPAPAAAGRSAEEGTVALVALPDPVRLPLVVPLPPIGASSTLRVTLPRGSIASVPA
jgi:hypothetical protein